MTGKSLRHKLRAGSEKDKQTVFIPLTHPCRRRNPIHTVHINIHKNHVEASLPESVQKNRRVRKGKCLDPTVVLYTKFPTDPLHFHRIFFLIIHKRQPHHAPLFNTFFTLIIFAISALCQSPHLCFR